MAIPVVLIPLAILVFYGGLANTVGLVTFPLASVLPVVLISALCCILVKVLTSRHYLVSYLSHFCPTRVSTKFRPFYSSLIITDISYMNNQDPDSTIHKRHVFWTETPKWRPLPEHMHYGDFNLIQGLARMVSCLELFRTLIRPASLSLRLSANISCGHILAVLSSGPAVPFSLFHILRPVLFIFALETLVCFVQCYVFYTLWRMYVGE